MRRYVRRLVRLFSPGIFSRLFLLLVELPLPALLQPFSLREGGNCRTVHGGRRRGRPAHFSSIQLKLSVNTLLRAWLRSESANAPSEADVGQRSQHCDDMLCSTRIAQMPHGLAAHCLGTGKGTRAHGRREREREIEKLRATGECHRIDHPRCTRGRETGHTCCCRFGSV